MLITDNTPFSYQTYYAPKWGDSVFRDKGLDGMAFFDIDSPLIHQTAVNKKKALESWQSKGFYPSEMHLFTAQIPSINMFLMKQDSSLGLPPWFTRMNKAVVPLIALSPPTEQLEVIRFLFIASLMQFWVSNCSIISQHKQETFVTLTLMTECLVDIYEASPSKINQFQLLY